MSDQEKNYYAHSIEGRPTAEWQPLEEHLHNVASQAENFAGVFNAACWARILGEFHDLGKGTLAWQACTKS